MEITANVSGGANFSIAAPSLKIEAPKINMPSMSLNLAAPKVSIGGNLGINASAGIGGASLKIPSMSLNVAAPKVSIGGSLGINASAGIGGASLKIEAPKISMPSIGATKWSGYYEHGGDQYDMELDMTVGTGRIVG